MMNKFFLLLFCLLATVSAHAQRWRLEGQTGLGTYAMKDLKKFQKDNSTLTKVVQNFPPYFFFRGAFSVAPSKSWRTGVVYSLLSTGARSDYQDYSGQIRLDQAIHANCIGWTNSFEKKFNKFTCSLNVQASRSFTRLEVSQQVVVAGQPPYSGRFNYKSGSYLLDGFLQATYPVGPLHAGLFAGYCYDFKGTLKNNNGGVTDAQTDWSGLRTGISIGYNF